MKRLSRSTPRSHALRGNGVAAALRPRIFTTNDFKLGIHTRRQFSAAERPCVRSYAKRRNEVRRTIVVFHSVKERLLR